MIEKKIDKDGLICCELQAEAFEISLDKTTCSSQIFMRRFMNSKVAKLFDNGMILQTAITPDEIINRVEEEYGDTKYGSVKYSANELYWIGYIYRYFSYTYDISSLQAYKIVKPKELRDLFLPYHTMDCAVAIDRILEAKENPLAMEDIEYQYRIFKKIRGKMKG